MSSARAASSSWSRPMDFGTCWAGRRREADVAFLRSGGDSLLQHEQRLLGDLSGCPLAIHLMCSHGLDTLSLLNLGVHEVIGIDFSGEMLALAARKSELLGARARWVRAEVLSLPQELDAIAELVYTGKGALHRAAGGTCRAVLAQAQVHPGRRAAAASARILDSRAAARCLNSACDREDPATEAPPA
jgi:methyltransferase family protein